MDRNKALVEALNKHLPGSRAGLTAAEARRLPGGFTPVEVFRKYLWYLLRERAFNQEAVDDLVHLKQVSWWCVMWWCVMWWCVVCVMVVVCGVWCGGGGPCGV